MVAVFRPPLLRGLADHARRYAADPTTWPGAPRFDPTGRWYARIAGGHDHEAWLLSWLPGQATDLHDHGGSAGAFHVVSGELTEQTLRRAATLGLASRRYPAGATRPFDPQHVHRVANNGLVPAVSVHVYSPAITSMTRYRLRDGALCVATVERAGADW